MLIYRAQLYVQTVTKHTIYSMKTVRNKRLHFTCGTNITFDSVRIMQPFLIFSSLCEHVEMRNK